MQTGIRIPKEEDISDEPLKQELRGQIGSFYITKRKNYTAITKVISAKVPVSVLREIEELVEMGYYQNVSDFVREAIRRLLVEYKAKGILSKEPKPEPGVR
jgi:hypothetical protein